MSVGRSKDRGQALARHPGGSRGARAGASSVALDLICVYSSPFLGARALPAWLRRSSASRGRALARQQRLILLIQVLLPLPLISPPAPTARAPPARAPPRARPPRRPQARVPRHRKGHAHRRAPRLEERAQRAVVCPLGVTGGAGGRARAAQVKGGRGVGGEGAATQDPAAAPPEKAGQARARRRSLRCRALPTRKSPCAQSQFRPKRKVKCRIGDSNSGCHGHNVEY